MRVGFRYYKYAMHPVYIYCVCILGLVFFISDANAGACTAKNGDIINGQFDASQIIQNTSDNVAGHTETISLSNNVDKVETVCQCNPGQISDGSTWDWTRYMLPTEVVDGRTYAIVNDYLEVAIEAGTSRDKLMYIPYENQQHIPSSGSPDVCTSAGYSGGGGYNAVLRIRKPFVGFTDFGNQLIYQKGTNSASGDAERVPEINYYIKGQVIVPQNCELDEGTPIEMNFGNIGAAAFSQAGAGNKPAGVNPQTHTIGIKCKNIDAQVLLSLRLEANNVSGKAMVSDNADIGFIVADKNQNPLTPNDIDSTIPFRLDGNASATVPINAWPVSVTGNKPTEGTFTAEGYLRVDFQ